MNAAVWARVSTRQQDTDNQVQVLQEAAQRRGYDLAATFVLEESAWNGRHTAQLQQALQDARAGRFQVLLVWALDRLSREGIEPTLRIMRRFREAGVQVVSLQESWTDVPSEFQDIFTAFYAWVAQQESKRKSERTKAGLARRKAQGLPVGRQPGAADKTKRKRSGYYARWEQR